jgi:signal transduction histidine kinase
VTTPCVTVEGAEREAEPTYQEQLAAIGLATLLASPALMHGLKGRLHNIGLLTELLQKESARQTDVAALRASALRRTETIRTEIHALHGQLQLVEALLSDESGIEEKVCNVRESLRELTPTTRFEAARRRIIIELDVAPGVERIQCAPRPFQHLVLALVTQAVRHCGERATVTVSAARDGASTRIAFACDKPFPTPQNEADRRLLSLLAARVGALVGPDLSAISFRTAP